MDPESSSPQESHDLTISSTEMLRLKDGESSPLSEIINRSLVHIKTSKSLAVPVRSAGEVQEFEIVPGVKIVMCWIPPGEFMMGSPEDEIGGLDNETQHRVAIADGFWLGKYPVTQSQWEAVMGNNPSFFKGSNLPVEGVTWNDIVETMGFMEKINRLHTAEDIFFLPNEAQWEYACRAGITTALNSGKNLTTNVGACPNLDKVAWYWGNSSNGTRQIGKKKANNWGLHDMHGNVAEQCVEWYHNWSEEPFNGSLNPGLSSSRVIKGGSWAHNAFCCRAAWKHYDYDSRAVNYIGFRIARSSAPSRASGGIEWNDSVKQVKTIVHVQTSKILNRIHRIGEHELAWPDYQLVCYWARHLSISPMEVLMILLNPTPLSIVAAGYKTRIIEGHFVDLVVNGAIRSAKSFPAIEGLQIEKIHLCGMDLGDLNLVALPNLKELRCYANRLKKLDLSAVPNLTVLECEANELTDLDLSPVPNLKILCYYGNKLEKIDLSPVPNLSRLECGSNPITELDLSPVENLQVLDCSRHELTKLDLSHTPNLTELRCSENQLTELNFSYVPNLAFLWCHENQLTDLNLSLVPNLENLSCADNQLTELDISPLHQLKILSCGAIRLIQRHDQNFK
jgi:formylglycine-generating enzyme required for sulfatase activity